MGSDYRVTHLRISIGVVILHCRCVVLFMRHTYRIEFLVVDLSESMWALGGLGYGLGPWIEYICFRLPES